MERHVWVINQTEYMYGATTLFENSFLPNMSAPVPEKKAPGPTEGQKASEADEPTKKAGQEAPKQSTPRVVYVPKYVPGQPMPKFEDGVVYRADSSWDSDDDGDADYGSSIYGYD